MKNEEYDRTLFKVQRIFPPLELGSILRHSLGGKGFVNFMRRIKLGGYQLTVPDWKEGDLTLQNKIIIDNIPYLFCYDPAIELGFPELDPEDIADAEKIYSHITEEAKRRELNEADSKVFIKAQLRKQTEENARLYVDALNNANRGLIREIGEMPSLVLEEHIKQILKSGDDELRWRTAWALTVDDKLTRIKQISKLKYKNKENAIADYPYVFSAVSSGGMGLPFREKTLGMNADIVRVQLAGFRLFQTGRSIEDLTNDPSLVYIEMLVDNEAELEIYDRHAKKLSASIKKNEGQIGANKLKITGLEAELRTVNEAQQTLRSRVSELEKKGSSPVVATPVHSGDYVAARRKAEKAERTAEGLIGKLKTCNQEKLVLAEEVNGLKQTAKGQKFLIDLLRIKCELCDFYRGKTVAVICMEGQPDKWSEYISQFGANVELVQASKRVRQLEAIAEAKKYDVFFFPVSTGGHIVTDILPQFKTVTFDPREGSIPFVLYMSIERLRKAGVGAR